MTLLLTPQGRSNSPGPEPFVPNLRRNTPLEENTCQTELNFIKSLDLYNLYPIVSTVSNNNVAFIIHSDSVRSRELSIFSALGTKELAREKDKITNCSKTGLSYPR